MLPTPMLPIHTFHSIPYDELTARIEHGNNVINALWFTIQVIFVYSYTYSYIYSYIYIYI